MKESERLSLTAIKWNRSLAVVFTLFLFYVPCHAQKAVVAKIDEFIGRQMKSQRIPGLSLAVLKDGKPVLVKGYGYANIEHKIRVTPETIFQSGSIGKQFTATAVMLLVEDGRVSLDDRISKYFSDSPESWKNITVRHLLSHTSGLGDYPPTFDMRRDYTEDEMYSIIKPTPLNYPAGEGWDYSNLGYVLSGILIRKVTGKFYGEFLSERIFTPLGMTTARIISEADVIPNRASGYRILNGEIKNQEWVSPSVNSTADGSLYLTVLDMVKWDSALNNNKPFKQLKYEQMWAPAKLSGGRSKGYGFGWHTEELYGHRVVSHGGAWQGFKSFIVKLPDEKLTIIFFTNLWETHEFKLARGLTAILKSEFALPNAEPIEDKEPAVTALVKKVLLQFSTNTIDSKLFATETPREEADTIKSALNSLSLPIAIIMSSLDLVERKQESGLQSYRYTLIDLGKTLECTFKLTTDGKISHVQVREL
jgi:CubicO group peptidase (beta-lactamase class C family)